jgi:hypothetical protein
MISTLFIILIVIIPGIYIAGKMSKGTAKKYKDRRFSIRQHRKNREKEEDDDDDD